MGDSRNRIRTGTKTFLRLSVLDLIMDGVDTVSRSGQNRACVKFVRYLHHRLT
jgi:hypothetical protein